MLLGKKTFLVALGRWFTYLAGSNGIFIYRDLKDASCLFNLDKDSLSLVHPLRCCVISVGLAELDPWNSVQDCWDWLMANTKTIFLVLDELDELYKRSNCKKFLGELALLGGRDGRRPIMVILSGSSAYLRLRRYIKVHAEARSNISPNFPVMDVLQVSILPNTCLCHWGLSDQLKTYRLCSVCRVDNLSEARALLMKYGRYST